MRYGVLKSGQLKVSQIALGQNLWPEHVVKTSNCFHNQLETPILFYTLIAFIGVTTKTSMFFVTTAWLFVFCRYWHAAEEITRNHVPKRFIAFLSGSIALTTMWIGFFVDVMNFL